MDTILQHQQQSAAQVALEELWTININNHTLRKDQSKCIYLLGLFPSSLPQQCTEKKSPVPTSPFPTLRLLGLHVGSQQSFTVHCPSTDFPQLSQVHKAAGCPSLRCQEHSLQQRSWEWQSQPLANASCFSQRRSPGASPAACIHSAAAGRSGLSLCLK